MRVGVKFCGNCNPRVDMPAVLARLRERAADITFEGWDGAEYDVLLILSGCAVDCATRPSFAGPTVSATNDSVDRWPVDAAELTDAILATLWRAKDRRLGDDQPVHVKGCGIMVERNLAGLRVLDFTRVLAGPYLTQMLGDLGAEIIKIEQPGKGADERALPPIGANGQSGYYMMLNRGKKSITLNLKAPEAREIIFELARHADIVTENFKPGVMTALGLSYDAFRAVKPDIIMCSISTFGQAGPYAQRVGYDIVAQAMSGLMWMSGDADRPPTRSGTSIGDVNASAHALGAIGAALYYRERTGRGQYIDIALRDCLTAILETAIPRYTMSHGTDLPGRSGRHHATMGPYGVFDAGGGRYIVLGALNQAIWARLCKAMGHPEMTDDPRYNNPTVRGANRDEVTCVIERWLQSFDGAEQALAVLEKCDVPSAPVLSIDQLVADPQLLMRDMLVTVNDPLCGPVTMPATPMRFSETSVTNPIPPPLLGGDTEEVLHSLVGMTDRDIARLRERNVI